MSTFTTEGVMQIVTCCHEGCHVKFAMPDEWYDFFKKNTQRNFFCPAGHQQHFTGKSTEEQLKDKLAEAERKLTQEKCIVVNLRSSLNATYEERNRQARLKREAQKKLKKVCTRVHNGVCPCCNRTFANLARHMASKHPEAVK